MRIGFTGTREGMTGPQSEALWPLLDADEFHHGCCLGSDEEAHWLADSWNMPIVGHPPEDRRLMMDMDRRVLHTFQLLRDPKPYLDRNRDIVDETGLLVATPLVRVENPLDPSHRGGTLYTIRYAASKGKPVKIIWPDGSVDDH